MKLTIGAEVAQTGQVDEALMKALAQAHLWFGQLVRGEVQSIAEIASAAKKPNSYIGRVLKLAFLAPHIQEAIVNARQRPEITAKRLILRENLSLNWRTQVSHLST